MVQALPKGLYEQLLDEELQERISAFPELKSILRQIDDESAPHDYAQFVALLLQQALRQRLPHDRIPLLNRLIELVAAQDGLDYLQRRRLLSVRDSVLVAIPGNKGADLPRPVTPLNSSVLLTGQGGDACPGSEVLYSSCDFQKG